MDASLVTPGEEVGLAEQYEAGDGVYAWDGRLYATIVGARTFDTIDGHSATNDRHSGKVRHHSSSVACARSAALHQTDSDHMPAAVVLAVQPRLSVVGLKPLAIVPQPGDSVMARVSQSHPAARSSVSVLPDRHTTISSHSLPSLPLLPNR